MNIHVFYIIIPVTWNNPIFKKKEKRNYTSFSLFSISINLTFIFSLILFSSSITAVFFFRWWNAASLTQLIFKYLKCYDFNLLVFIICWDFPFPVYYKYIFCLFVFSNRATLPRITVSLVCWISMALRSSSTTGTTTPKLAKFSLC